MVCDIKWFVLGVRFVASLRNDGDSNATLLRKKSDFYLRVKCRGG